MTSRTALMMALAILLIVANVMGQEGQVSQIAAKDTAKLRDNMEQMSDMDGFTSEEKIGPQLSEEERSEEEQQAEAMAAANAGQPQIGEFSWEKGDGGEEETPSRRARVEMPAHHKMAPGEVREDFNPTIRRN